MQCVSAQLGTLAELLRKVDSDIPPTFFREEPEAHRCLTSLQDGLRIVQLVLDSNNHRVEDSDLQNQNQVETNGESKFKFLVNTLLVPEEESYKFLLLCRQY